MFLCMLHHSFWLAIFVDHNPLSPSLTSVLFVSVCQVFGVNWGKGSHHEGSHPIAGAFAEYIVVPAARVSKMPNISYNQAAAISLVGLTASQSLDVLDIGQTSKRVLILGGAGAVGMVAVGLAKLRGAWVATTCSDRTIEEVKKLGADKIINYREKKWWEDEELKNIDAIFDTVGEDDTFKHAQTILKKDGYFTSIASFEVGVDPAAHAPLKFARYATSMQRVVPVCSNRNLFILICQRNDESSPLPELSSFLCHYFLSSFL